MKISERSPLRYPGGKYRARKILYEAMPEKTVRTVLSPFFGGGSFELFLTGKGVTVHAADGFNILALFWEQLQNDPNRLSEMLQKYLGKINKPLFLSMQDELKAVCGGNSNLALLDDNRKYDLAMKFYIVNRCSFSGSTLCGGFSGESSRTRFTQSSIDRIAEFNNHRLTVEHSLFEDFIPANSHGVDLIFCDPPYMLDETSKNSLYGIGGDLHKEFDHWNLKEIIDQADKPALLTYNDCDPVRQLWRDYNINDTAWSYGMNASKKSSEIIITNY